MKTIQDTSTTRAFLFSQKKTRVNGKFVYIFIKINFHFKINYSHILFILFHRCLHSLSKSYSKYLLEPEKKLNMDGIDSVELFIGEADSMTGWHVEDLNLGSVNFHVSGKPKTWVE